LNPSRFAFVLTRTRLKKTLRVCPQTPAFLKKLSRRRLHEQLKFLNGDYQEFLCVSHRMNLHAGMLCAINFDWQGGSTLRLAAG
jgi:hypothetical protein